MKTKKQVINSILLAIPPLRKKILQRLKDNEILATNAALSCDSVINACDFNHYSRLAIHYRRVIEKIESKYKLKIY